MTSKTITMARDNIERLIDRLGKAQMFKEVTELRAALADPVPPVGGDVKVLPERKPGGQWLDDGSGHASDWHEDPDANGWNAACDAWAPHVTRLQAEVERLTAQKADAVAVVDETDDGLFIEIIYGDGGSSLRRGDKLYTAPSDRGYVSRLAYDALQSELTKLGDDYCKRADELTRAREVLREIIGACGDKNSHGYISMLAEDALSNQSAPADKECAHRFMSLADDPRRCADCDAVEMHDKPVVRLELVRSGLSEGLHIRVWENLGNLWPGVHMLYLGPAAQPAPVAVVMPERFNVVMQYLMGIGDLDGYYFRDSHPSGRKYWWRNELRACLDEFGRLNSEPKP